MIGDTSLSSSLTAIVREYPLTQLPQPDYGKLKYHNDRQVLTGITDMQSVAAIYELTRSRLCTKARISLLVHLDDLI
jgi:hypothetical protein